VRILITASVPSIRLIVPTPDVSAASAYDNSVEVTIARSGKEEVDARPLLRLGLVRGGPDAVQHHARL
jgi:hypothetical protein